MVKTVQAFEASDGQVFTDERKALEHEAVKKLMQLDVFNAASANAMVAKIADVMEALVPLMAYIEEQDRRNSAEKAA